MPLSEDLRNAGIRLHVVGFGDDAAGLASLDRIAARGGTGSALDARSPEELDNAIDDVLTKVRDTVVVPQCLDQLPRVMVLVDASSSMFVGAQGETHWDKARMALSGNPQAPNPSDPGYVAPLFERTIALGSDDATLEDLMLIGLTAFGDAETQRLMLDYAPCARDNMRDMARNLGR